MVSFCEATVADFQGIYDIWMQSHVLPFLSFEQMSPEALKPTFISIMKTSQVYVIKEGEQIVAVQRIIYNEGRYAHIAQLGSFAVHKDYARKGYGKEFYKQIFAILHDKPEIKRIELAQTTDNEPALSLATKMGFKPDFVFPEWGRRATGPDTFKGKWYIPSRYMFRLLDNTLADPSIPQVTAFTPKVPALMADNNQGHLHMERSADNNTITCFCHHQKMATITITPWKIRAAHIQQWKIVSEAGFHAHALETCLRQLIFNVPEKCMKIETFVSDQATAEVLRNLGFYCRGIREYGCKIGAHYYHETAADFSFFGIAEAIQLMNIYVDDARLYAAASEALICCQKDINSALNQNQIDPFAQYFLKNMAFQMTREAFGEKALQRAAYNNEDPFVWDDMIAMLPVTLQSGFVALNQIANTAQAKMLSKQLLVK